MSVFVCVRESLRHGSFLYLWPRGKCLSLFLFPAIHSFTFFFFLRLPHFRLYWELGILSVSQNRLGCSNKQPQNLCGVPLKISRFYFGILHVSRERAESNYQPCFLKIAQGRKENPDCPSGLWLISANQNIIKNIISDNRKKVWKKNKGPSTHLFSWMQFNTQPL